MLSKSASVCIFEQEQSANRRSIFSITQAVNYHNVVVPVKIKFPELSKLGALYLGFLKYINSDIQIIHVSLVGDPLQGDESIWQMPSSYLKKTVLTAGQ